MYIKSLKDSEKLAINVQAHKVLNENDLEIIHLRLKPGEKIELHTNNFDVAACLIKGEVLLHDDTNTFVLDLYSTAFINKNTLRGLTNHSETEARLLMIKQLYTSEK